MRDFLRRPSIPWVLPFGALLALVGVMPRLGVGPLTDQAVRVALVGALLVVFSRPVLDFRAPRWLGSVSLGILVFAVWVTPDLLWPDYRDSVVFSNALLGRPGSAFPEAARNDPLVVALRMVRAVLVIPIAEELFWRGWLPRWIASTDFRAVPLGTFTAGGFVLTAVLFGLEHGSYWDVGLLAGVAYNWWMLRTRSLGDCILAHAVTNACLAAYVVGTGRWEFW